MSPNKIKAFLGTRVFSLLIASVVVGILLSFVEVSFSVLIQSFLASMGVIDLKATKLPSWMPGALSGTTSEAFELNLVCLVAFALIRGFIQWFKVYAHSLTSEAFTDHFKNMVANWAIADRKSDSATVITFLTDRIPGVAALMTAFQNSTIHIFSLTLLVAYLLNLSLVLTLLGIFTVLLFGLMLKALDRHVKVAGDQIYRNSIKVNEKLLDAMKNLHLLKICRADTTELLKIRVSLNQYFKSARLYNAIRATKFASPQIIGVIVIVLIAYYNQKKEMVLAGGAFVTFVYLFMRTAQISSELSSTISTLQIYVPQLKQLYGWWQKNSGFLEWDIKQQHQFSKSKNELPPAAWSVRDLSFCYTDSDIIKNLSLDIEPGSLLVVTGPSGIGKSTLLDLLAGILKPQKGSVLLNGKAVDEAQVRFGFVGPDPFVITGTIRENLLYAYPQDENDKSGSASVSDSLLNEALETSYCTEFLNHLPQDLNRTLTNRGEGLSAGQRQRLALARALLRKPNALLLDEPTSNLDEYSEAKVVETLSRLKGKMTIIVVTHRKAVLEIADKKLDFAST